MTEASDRAVDVDPRHVKCQICCIRFTDPKVLDCLHSFCMKCLDELSSRQHPNAIRLICPLCGRVTAVAENGVSGLPNRFPLGSSHVDEVEHEQRGDVVVTPTCEGCDEGLVANSRCLECKENICQKCQEAHRRVKSTKTHQIIPLTHRETGVSPGAVVETFHSRCRKHTDQVLCYYCETCQVLICAKCAAMDHRSAEHKYTEVAVATQSREDVNEFSQKCEKRREQFRILEDSIKHARNRLGIMVDKACRDITSKEEEEIAKIKTSARLLREKVTHIGKYRDTDFAQALSSNREKMNWADELVGSVSESIQGHDLKVMHDLKLLEELHFQPVEHGLSFIGVKCHDVTRDTDLAKILLEEKWQLREEFDNTGQEDRKFSMTRGIACFSNGDIVVSDTGKNRISIISAGGRYKTSSPQGDEEVYGVAVTPNDLLLVTDKTKVKVFDSNFRLIHQFTPLMGDPETHSSSSLTGIDVDRKNSLVAVADRDRSVISLHNLNGSLIRTIPNTMVRSYMAIASNERLIFTNDMNNRLVSVDFQGNEVFNVRLSFDRIPATPLSVWGLCSDEAGDIYVCVHFGHFGSRLGQIHKYTPQGVHVGCVAEGLFCPFDVTFNPRGDLVVADMLSVKVFHRV